MNKKIRIIFIGIMLLLPLACLFYNIKQGDERILNSYSQLKDQQHIVKMLDAKQVDSLIENKKTYVLFMGFERCPWCQDLMPYYNEIAKENRIEEIYYLDILEMRTNVDSKDRYVYDKLYQILLDASPTSTRIGAPTIFFVKEGILQAYHVGTVAGHERVDGVLPPMTDDQIKLLKDSLNMEFKKVTSQ